MRCKGVYLIAVLLVALVVMVTLFKSSHRGVRRGGYDYHPVIALETQSPNTDPTSPPVDARTLARETTTAPSVQSTTTDPPVSPSLAGGEAGEATVAATATPLSASPATDGSVQEKRNKVREVSCGPGWVWVRGWCVLLDNLSEEPLKII